MLPTPSTGLPPPGTPPGTPPGPPARTPPHRPATGRPDAPPDIPVATYQALPAPGVAGPQTTPGPAAARPTAASAGEPGALAPATAPAAPGPAAEPAATPEVPPAPAAAQGPAVSRPVIEPTGPPNAPPGPAAQAPTTDAPAPLGDPIADAPPGPLWHRAPGLTPYPDALATMAARAAAIRAEAAPELVWLVEHPPLYTAGTSARRADLADPHRFPTYDAGRGGQWTYHGPGQRTAYVLLDLARPHGAVRPRDVRDYVAGLEAWLIATLALLGVRGERRPGRVGIWVATPLGEAKVAALGVRVTRWVSWHGVALNVAPALEHFDGIVPCGIREHGVTSLAALGAPCSMAEADAALLASWPAVFG